MVDPSKTLLDSLFEHTSDAVCVIDANQNITAVNPVFQSLFGFDEAEIINSNLSRLYADSDSYSLAHTDDRPTDMLFVSRSRQTFWGKMKVQAVSAQGDHLCIISDLSYQRDLEGQIKNSDRLLRDAVGSANQAAWKMSLERNRITLSGPIVHFLGYESVSVDLSVEEWRNFIHPDDRCICENGAAGLLQGKDATGEYRLRNPKGEYRWMSNRGRLNVTLPGQEKTASGFIIDIDDRKQLESRYKQVDRQLADALKAADLAAWRYDLTDHTATIRGDLAAHLGVDQDNPTMAGPDWVERVHVEDKGAVVAGTMAVANGETHQFDVLYRVRDTSGQWRWIHSTGRVTKTADDGTPIIASGVLKDETIRIRLEQTIKSEKERFEQIYRATPAMMHTIDTQGRLLEVSDYWLDQMGYLRDDVLGRPSTDFLTPESREKCLADNGIALFWKAGQCSNIPYDWKTRDGRVIRSLLSGVLEKNAKGEALRAHAVLVDITERKVLESALREEKYRFERIYRASPAMMHTIDASGRITQVSDYWLMVMGFDRDEVIGKRSVDFLDAESRNRAEAHFLPELFAQGRNTNVPYRFVKKNGESIDILLSSFLERDEAGQAVASYAVSTDVTALRLANDGLKRSNRELDRFATVASHDLQEPLRKISAFASLLNRRHSEGLEDDARRALNFMSDAALRMQSLIDELLNYSRLSNQVMSTADINMSDAVAEAVNRLDSVLSDTGAMVCIGDLASCQGDQSVIVQVFQNLISNAVKYRGKDTPQIDVASRMEDDRIVYSVADNGIGFDARFSEKIFAPFQRLHARGEYPGNGIGLAIVQQAVERHGGDVWVTSEPGQGSTFYFSLPRVQTLQSVA